MVNIYIYIYIYIYILVKYIFILYIYVGIKLYCSFVMYKSQQIIKDNMSLN
jgi:hypothetical protein